MITTNRTEELMNGIEYYNASVNRYQDEENRQKWNYYKSLLERELKTELELNLLSVQRQKKVLQREKANKPYMTETEHQRIMLHYSTLTIEEYELERMIANN